MLQHDDARPRTLDQDRLSHHKVQFGPPDVSIEENNVFFHNLRRISATQWLSSVGQWITGFIHSVGLPRELIIYNTHIQYVIMYKIQ